MQTSSSSSSSSSWFARAQRARLVDAWLLASVVVGAFFFRMMSEFIPEVVLPTFCSRNTGPSHPQVLTDRGFIATLTGRLSLILSQKALSVSRFTTLFTSGTIVFVTSATKC